MTDQADWEGRAMDVALARYAVIAPLVSRSMSGEERRRQVQEVASAVHCFPGGKQKRVSPRSVRRWTRWFLEGHRNEKNEIVSAAGVEALKPLVRADRGVPRKAEPVVLDRAERLRREEPVRTTGTLIDILKSEAAAREQEPPDISEATLAYHLRARGASRRDLKREGRAFRRYLPLSYDDHPEQAA
jgi:putative transposase